MSLLIDAGLDETVSAPVLAQRLHHSERLRQRRFEVLPTRGPGAPFAEVQGRGPGPSTAPAELVELISSIASVGVLQPVLVEELPGAGMRLVAGERRMRAVQWGAVHHPEIPHFSTLPAVVCPGPLSEAERRVWQLVENLAREDLQPGELAAALMFERCAVLVAKLLGAGVPVPAAVAYLDDPVARFRALDRLRVEAGCHHLGAPWGEVLRRLGIQIRAERAKALVRAFAALPPELSEEMDAHKVALATRLEYLRLGRGGRADAAGELWAAVRARGRPELLASAVREQLEHPDLGADEALERAAEFREAADEARSRAQLRPEPDPAAAELGDDADRIDERPADPASVADALSALRRLLGELRAGRRLSRYDAGSLALFAGELAELAEGQRQGADPRGEAA